MFAPLVVKHHGRRGMRQASYDTRRRLAHPIPLIVSREPRFLNLINNRSIFDKQFSVLTVWDVGVRGGWGGDGGEGAVARGARL